MPCSNAYLMRSPSLLVVVGASGTGKLSVVKAGLLPQLAAATAARSAGTQGWALIEVARLGAHPQVQLDEALRNLPPLAAGARPLLLFDQFEELYTQCTDASLYRPSCSVCARCWTRPMAR